MPKSPAALIGRERRDKGKNKRQPDAQPLPEQPTAERSRRWQAWLTWSTARANHVGTVVKTLPGQGLVSRVRRGSSAPGRTKSG